VTPALRTIEDFVRHRLGVDRTLRLHVFPTKDGRFQASIENTRSGGWTVEIHDDPIDAIWNVLVPYTMRRGPMTPHNAGVDEAKAAGAALDAAPSLPPTPLEQAIAAVSVDPFADMFG